MPTWIFGRFERTILGFPRTRGRKRLWVDVLRCTACGYLESYANQPYK